MEATPQIPRRSGSFDRWVSTNAEPWLLRLALARTRQAGESDGEGFRDLYPHDPGASLGGDHRPGDQEQVPVRRQGDLGLDSRLTFRDGRAGCERPPRRRRERLADDPLRSEDVARDGRASHDAGIASLRLSRTRAA